MQCPNNYRDLPALFKKCQNKDLIPSTIIISKTCVRGAMFAPFSDLASGVQDSLAAASAVIRTVAAAPSERVLAFPAVTVPPTFWNTEEIIVFIYLLRIWQFFTESYSHTMEKFQFWPRFH